MIEHSVTVIDVHDGDTVRLCAKLAHGISFEFSARLTGINAPEVTGESRQRGLASRWNLVGLLSMYGDSLKARIDEKNERDKYGRMLVTLVGLDKTGAEVDLNQRMVAEGYATEYDGKTKAHAEQSAATMVLSIYDCARCGGDHFELAFVGLVNPPTEYSHFAMCPVALQPILMRIESSNH